MKYTRSEVTQFVNEEDVKFIRLAFCDVFGKQKNISILSSELDRAFEQGIAIDASSIEGFGNEARSDLFLFPDPATLIVLPWRPEHGKVVRMFCDIRWPNGKPFEGDTRQLLKKAVSVAEQAGYSFFFGAELEFYLLMRDELGKPIKEPYDDAGYMDIAPDDKGENIRREICLTLEQMGIRPESSHHEGGPGQNEIDFRYSDPLTAADNAVTFCTVVKTVANRNGLYADFSPKPFDGLPGNGLHINFSIQGNSSPTSFESSMAGVMKNISEMTLFFNPKAESYKRLGNNKAPKYISWSAENRSQLVRIPAASGDFKRAELRSPDPCANPYIAYSLMIHACMDGIQSGLQLPPASDFNLFSACSEVLDKFSQLPQTLSEAKDAAMSSDFIKSHMPDIVLSAFINQ